jgi:hypothetical protein
VTKYPLAWPTGWKRAQRRASANFNKKEWKPSSFDPNKQIQQGRALTVNDATQRVLSALQRFGVLEGDAIISTNLQLRLDGLPRSNQPEPADPGAAIYWKRPGEGMKCMAIDRYDRVADNIAAIAATLDAMRAIERHGGALILERAFMGFDALPAPGQTMARGWMDILGVGEDVTLETAQAAYRKLSSVHHPDKPGGSHEAMSELNWAWAQAQAALQRH